MSIYETHQPSTGGGDFLKLKDGDKVKMRIATEPAISVYKAGDKPRYSWVIWNRDADKPQVYSAGVSVFKQIAALVEDWGEPTEFDVRISRSGSGMNDTEYMVSPVKESKKLTTEELDKVNAIDLLKLIKGKMLADYEEDGKLPPPVMEYVGETPDYTDEDAPLDINDLPL